MRSLNPYKGCGHGCSYCYARQYHEYLGLSCGLDFETKIFAKSEAPELLRAELAKSRYEPRAIALSGATDPYQPVEKKLRITRRCLEVLAECRHPVCVITKSSLVERDIDLLSELARHNAASVAVSVTTLDANLQRALEPRASTPAARLRTIRALTDAGIPVWTNVAPVIPGLTDHEIPEILRAAAEAGTRRATYILLRLPHAVKDVFEQWLENHVPLRKEKVLNRLRQMHGGKLYDSAFGKRMSGEGPFAEQMAQLFEIACRKHRINSQEIHLSTEAFRKPTMGGQLELF